MDATQLLISDHRKFKALFEQFRGESGRQQQIMIFGTLFNDLQTHSYIEESVFYPACNQYPECKEFIEQAFADHQRLKDQLDEITGLPQDSREFTGKVSAMMDTFNQHAEQEEDELFPLVRQRMNANELALMGRQMDAARAEVPDSWKMAA